MDSYRDSLCASAGCVKSVELPRRGRGLVATRAFSAGAILFVEQPLGSLQHDSRVSFRDLLEIEQPPSSSSSSRIFPRAHSILFHLGPARGVILRDRVVLFASNAKSSISPLAAAEELCAHIASVGREPAFSSPPLEIIAVDHFLQRMVQRQRSRRHAQPPPRRVQDQ